MAKNTDEKLNIQEAIKAFGSKNFSEAGINLFSTLGYDTSLQAPLDDKTYQEFKETYIEGSPNAERFNEEKALVENWKSIDILFQLTNESFNGTKSLFEPSVNPYDPQSYLCFAIELNNSEYSKSHIANITREVNKLFSIPIIIIFKYGECITLAIINRRVNKRNSDRDVLEKVTLIKDIFFEKPHRAHIEILFDMSLPQLSVEYQINNFDSLHKAWSEVLDTQTLNKRFYTELSNWYFWAIKTVVYPGYEYEAQRNSLFTKEEKLREHNAKNLIRLLTRLLFVWFIKEKDLIPEELFDEKQIKEIITNFEPEKQYDFSAVHPELKSIYYKAILQNLFFASLNAEHGKRAFRIDGQNQNATSLMRYQRYHKNPEAFVKLIESKVPFMNGGLFECLDHQDDELKGKKGGAVIDYEDGFSDRKDNELFVPDYVFFGKEIKVDLSSEYDDKKKKDVTVNGIINILQKYKFTIAENTPVEEDIALDPELLGRVFENLLASYNPETKTNARKQTGSFYTPRPIVEYMVDESLKAYLKTKIKDVALSKGTLEEKTAAIAELDKTIDSKLDILVSYNENELDFSEEERKEILRYIDECKILDPACGSGAFPMGILQKMVYVIHKLDPQNDNWKLLQIEKIMTAPNITSKEKNDMIAEISSIFDDNDLDYARKLYLIENCIHGIDIQPIATQISRLRFFISLIVDQKVDSTKPNFGVRPLPNLENRFVTANSLIGLNDEQATLFDKDIEPLMERLQKVRHNLFNAKSPKYKFELKQEDKQIRQDLEQTLMNLGFGKENAKLISTWDPYDKNRSAEFFDAEWMFGIKDGFDVVIGNPPYVQLQGDGGKLAKIYENQKFAAFAKTGDIYCLFYEKGFNLLNTKGLLCFITSNKWMRAGYGEKLRDFFAKNVNPILLVDFAGVKVFDSATVDTNIILFEKAKNSGKTKSYIATSLTKDGLSNLSDFVQQNSCDCSFTTKESWVILSPIEQSIKKKIESAGVPLKDWDISINYGIKTGFNDAFIISGEKREEILNNCKTKEERKKTDELIRPILRGRDIKRYEYNFADLYLINTHNGVKEKNIPRIDIKDYPAIKKHLDEYWEKIEKRADQGDTPYNLRNCAYMDDFNKPKLVYPETTQGAFFAYDEDGIYIDKTCFMMTGKDKKTLKYLQKTLSSRLFEFAYKSIFSSIELGQNGYQYNKHALIKLPIINKVIDLPNNENEINNAIFQLYNLNAKEIELVNTHK